MPSVGPTLPRTHAEKRKRDGQEDKDGELSRNSRSSSPSSASKKARTIGPAPPPADLDERPTHPPDSNSESSSDDDDFGPNLPNGSSTKQGRTPDEPQTISSAGPQKPVKTQRDEWMVVPPSSGDWSSRVDPTKLKNRKFNTGKGAKGPAQSTGRESNASWTETPDEKRARLEREMMGKKEVSAPKNSSTDDVKVQENARKLREYNVGSPLLVSFVLGTDNSQEKQRGPTLYKEHQKSNPQEKEDDPSARAFDREKDIAGGMKINHTQRREMMKKAADFGSRFSSGKFL
jgi:Protein of unknown function (DUF3752)